MKRLTTNSISFIFGIVILLVALFISCDKTEMPVEDQTPVNNPNDTSLVIIEGVRVINSTSIDIGITCITLTGRITKLQAETFKIIQHGHVLSSTNTLPTVEENDGISERGNLGGIGNITSEICNLKPSTKYYARLYVTIEYDSGTLEILYPEGTSSVSPSISFTTDDAIPPIIEFVSNSNSHNSITVNGQITNFNELNIVEYGYIWSTTHTTENTLLVNQNEGVQSYSEDILIQDPPATLPQYSITELQAATSYHLRVFAKNEYAEYGYSPILQVNTSVDPVAEIILKSDPVFFTGDLIPEGEVTYLITLENIGGAAAEDVKLSLNSPDIIFNDAVEFGTISPNNVQTREVSFTIKGTVLPGDIIQPDIVISSGNGGEPWIYNFTTSSIQAPPSANLYIESIEVKFDTNGDNEANPGEILTFDVTVANDGQLDAANINVLFNSNKLDILSANPLSFGTINSGLNKIRQLEVRINDDLQWGELIDLYVDIEADGGYNTTDDYSIEVASPYVVNENLLYYLTFENENLFNIGQVENLFGGLNGVVNGDIQLSTDTPENTGLSMDFPAGGGNNIKIPGDPLSDSPEFSICFWAKTSDSDGCIFDGNILYGTSESTNRNNNIWLIGTKLRLFGIYTNYHVTNIVLDNQWHHIAITKSNQAIQKIYIDGVLFDEISFDGDSDDAVKYSGFYIGEDSYNNENNTKSPYTGKLDNFRMYNRILSNNEIQLIYDLRQ